ncbi:MAG TPA: hypothetical protein VNJ54_00400 [Plantibacter sp.]|uniref:hypothetical protein n=1 Tax=Plantibacter sp. TaxID=1871045 RepID=UPI002B6155FB|nr:hypothetical protein [Plantibacter sp.]
MNDTREKSTLQEAMEFRDRLEAEWDSDRLPELLGRVRDRNDLCEAGNEWDAIIEALEERVEDERNLDPLDITVHGQRQLYGEDWTVDYIDVLIGTGGPACGIEFRDSDDAKCWFQNWFTVREYAYLSSTVAQHIADHLGLEF